MSAAEADPFGAGRRRAAVLTAWSASPTRFREDANAEEDLVVGGYADRLLVELAQNAADAAARAGRPGRLAVRLTRHGAGWALSAANTGAPLDAAGVDSLTSLRASAKRDTPGSVGRFGVGFAAVLTVSDEPCLRSVAGGVRFSAAATRDAIAGDDRLRAEADRRSGRVPVLRLAWPDGTAPPEGFDTEVYLPLTGDAAVDAVRAALADFDPALLLGLDRLAEVRLDDRVLRRTTAGDGPGVGAVCRGASGADTVGTRPNTGAVDGGAPGARDTPAGVVDRGTGDEGTAAHGDPAGGTVGADVAGATGEDRCADVLIDADGVRTRWRVARSGGRLDPALLADRPVEERAHNRWSVLAAVPVTDAGVARPSAGPQVLHAPTPSDEPVGLPVRLIGTFPLDTTRRRVPAGALTDRLVRYAADTVAALCAALADTPDVLALLPPPGLAAGRIAGPLRAAVADRLRDTDLLPAAAGGRMRPARALAVPDALVGPLTDVLDGLLPAGWWRPETAGTLTELGVRAPGLAEVVAAVTGRHRSPTWWHRLYAALAELSPGPAEREALGALPVPLADGRTVTGPARVLLAAGHELPAGLAAVGLLVTHPDAAHPLLERLGARPATPAAVLRDDRVRAAVADSIDAEDPGPVADAVLRLVAAAGTGPAWLSELALPDTAGDWYPAADLLLPGSGLPEVLDPDAGLGVAAEWLVAEHGADVLTAVGVLDTFAVLDESDVDVVDLAELDLDDADGWADAVRAAVGDVELTGARLARVRAVRDLELVRADRWDAALALLAAPPLRAVLAEECRLVTAAGERLTVPGYTRWWLSRRPVLGGLRPVRCRTGDSELAGLYEAAPGDPEVAAMLGAHRGLPDLLTAAAADPDVALDLLDRLGDPQRTVLPELLAVLYPRLAVVLDGRDVPPPARIRVAPELVVGPDRAAVCDRPWLLDRLAGRHPVPAGAVPVAVADLLDVPLLSEL